MKYKTRVWQPFRIQSYRSQWYGKKIIGIVKELYRDIRRCHERIWKGYCDYDTFSIADWFLGLMPTMLQEYKDHLHGCPVEPGFISHKVFLSSDEAQDDEDLKAWKDVLDQMIFLLKEADEETCSQVNLYEEEYFHVLKENREKHGVGFLPLEEKYRPLEDKYFEEKHKLDQYRKARKNDALVLFSKWFYDLWD